MLARVTWFERQTLYVTHSCPSISITLANKSLLMCLDYPRSHAYPQRASA
jgi:hypothetical protein